MTSLGSSGVFECSQRQRPPYTPAAGLGCSPGALPSAAAPHHLTPKPGDPVGGPGAAARAVAAAVVEEAEAEEEEERLPILQARWERCSGALQGGGYRLTCPGIAIATIPRGLLNRTPLSDTITELDISFGSVRDTSALAALPLLRVMIADQNLLESLRVVPRLPLLATLSVNKNLLDDVHAVASELPRFPALVHLSLLGNTCCPSGLSGEGQGRYHGYRDVISAACPTLKFLDSKAVLKPGVMVVDGFLVVGSAKAAGAGGSVMEVDKEAGAVAANRAGFVRQGITPLSDVLNLDVKAALESDQYVDRLSKRVLQKKRNNGQISAEELSHILKVQAQALDASADPGRGKPAALQQRASPPPPTPAASTLGARAPGSTSAGLEPDAAGRQTTVLTRATSSALSTPENRAIEAAELLFTPAGLNDSLSALAVGVDLEALCGVETPPSTPPRATLAQCGL